MTMNGKRCVLHRHAHAQCESRDGGHQREPFYFELLNYGLSELKYVFIHILLNICSVIYCNFFSCTQRSSLVEKIKAVSKTYCLVLCFVSVLSRPDEEIPNI